MKTMRGRRRGLLLFLAVAMTVWACSPAAEEAPPAAAEAPAPADEAETEPEEPDEQCESMTVRASHHIGEDSAGHCGFVALAEEVSARTDGRVEIDVFPAAQLGGLAETVENVREGTIELGLMGAGAVSAIASEVGVLDLPFLFQTQDQFNSLLDGALGDYLNPIISAAGIEPLYWFSVGFRDMFFVDGVGPVTHPDDLRGVPMRVPEAPTFVATFQALGTNPTVLPAADLYTGMQTGVVQGFELPLGTTIDLSLQEVSASMSLTRHIHTGTMIGASQRWLDSLCATDRAAVEDAVQAAKEVMRAGWVADNEAAFEVLEQELEVHEVDFDAFRAAMEPVYDGFRAEQPGVLEEVEAILAG